MHVAITHLVDLCVRRNTFDVSDFSAFIFNVELHVLVLWAFSVSLMLHRLVWWRVLKFDLLWQSETRCRPKQLKHSCLVWLFSYTDASFHILDHHLKNAYQYKMHNICEVSLEWSLGHLLDFIIGFILTGCSILHWVLYPLYLFQPLTFQVPWTNCFSVIQVSNW